MGGTTHEAAAGTSGQQGLDPARYAAPDSERGTPLHNGQLLHVLSGIRVIEYPEPLIDGHTRFVIHGDFRRSTGYKENIAVQQIVKGYMQKWAGLGHPDQRFFRQKLPVTPQDGDWEAVARASLVAQTTVVLCSATDAFFAAARTLADLRPVALVLCGLVRSHGGQLLAKESGEVELVGEASEGPRLRVGTTPTALVAAAETLLDIGGECEPLAQRLLTNSSDDNLVREHVEALKEHYRKLGTAIAELESDNTEGA